MRTSETTAALFKAMSATQAAMKPAAKDALNPHFKSKYADLAGHVEVIQPAATAHGLSWFQELTAADGGVQVTTRIAHASGEWIELGPLFVPASKQDAQGYGSACSYARRYALSAAFGTVADDDDGNAASRRPEPQTVVNAATGEDVPVSSLPAAPAGYHYLTDYTVKGEWHEAVALRWDAQGGALKVATKRQQLGSLLGQIVRDGLPAKLDVTIKKNSRGEAYLNAISAYHPETLVKDEPVEMLDASSIPF